MNEDLQAILTRISYGEKQALGELLIMDKGEVIYDCKTLELPWKDNQRRVSCIPEGSYRVKKRKASESPSQEEGHFHVLNVPDRDWILIHPANYYSDLLGCIGAGQEFADINKDGLKDITHSKRTLRELYSILPEEFELIITSTLDA